MVGKLCAALRVIELGPKGVVLATPRLWADLDEVRRSIEGKLGLGGNGVTRLSRHEKGVRRARAHMAGLASMGFQLVRATGGLVPEGRHPSGIPGGADVALFAFKHDQYRCYGSHLPYGSPPCFVVIEADEAKKQNKADQALLRRAALEFGELIHEVEHNPLTANDVWPPQQQRS